MLLSLAIIFLVGLSAAAIFERIGLDDASKEQIINDIRQRIFLQDITEFAMLTSVCASISPQYSKICRNNHFYFCNIINSYRHSKWDVLITLLDEFPDNSEEQNTILARLLERGYRKDDKNER